jgi:uncharacterized hydrophobic protein (TIGR00271 family)
MKSMVVVSHPQNTLAVIRWAARFAQTRASSLAILCCTFDGPIQLPSPIEEDPAPDEPELILKAREAATELQELQVEIFAMRHPRPERIIVEHIEREEKFTLLSVGINSGLGREDSGNRMARYMLHFAPCDILVLDPGDQDGTGYQQILVPMGMRLESFAFRCAVDFAKKWQSAVVPLEIGSYFGPDSREVAERALANRLKIDGIEPADVIQPLISLSGEKWQSVVHKSRKSDLVLLGASATRALDQLRKVETQMADLKGKRGSIGLLRPKKLGTKKTWFNIWSLLTSWLPTLSAGERIDVFDRLYVGARWNVDFITMISLSTAIASLGLIQDSVAVVIGAMVVAPLMTPLIGAGFSMVQGNMRFFRDSLRAMVYGITAALTISVVIGLITPLEELTPQLLARGAPTLLDLGVALLSGIAAAYAMARPTLLGAMAGVAIAAALVPPLATVGISLTHAEWTTATGAAILFTTNLVAIILGASWIFGRLGIQGTWLGIGLRLWVRRTIILLILSSVFLSAPLGFQLKQQLLAGQTRPYTLPVSQTVYGSVAARVQQEDGVRLISASRFGVKSDTDVTILLAAEKAVGADFVSELKKVVIDAMQEDVQVAVFVFKGVGMSHD